MKKDKLLNGSYLLYWAYGSNLSVDAMSRRCPGAEPIRALSLPSGALVFRGVADVVYREDNKVHGGLWIINRRNEKTLDAYEGVASGLYLKRYLKLKIRGINKPMQCLYYQMAITRGVLPPSEPYLDVIAKGYNDFGLPLEALNRALEESWNEKKVTERLRARHERRGGKLAKVVDFSF